MLRPSRRSLHRHARAFTLIELLVVIGMLALLGILTIISVQRLSKSSRLSSALNTVTSALQTARAYAIRENKLVVVVFRPIWDVNNKQKPQQTEIDVAEWTKQGVVFAGAPGNLDVADRFVVVNGVKPIRLPVGVKVAGPLYEDGEDGNWVTQGDMGGILNGTEGIEYSRMIAVMFAPNGAMVTRNPSASAGDTKAFVDFNLTDLTPADGDPQDVAAGNVAVGQYQRYWMQDSVDDECNLTVVPFLAVYDDRQAREQKTLAWTDSGNILIDLLEPSGFVTTNGQRIHFNRFTGVAEVQQ